MARRELGIWRRLNHPNIVPFLGIATGFGLKDSTSLVSLWMSNGTLECFLRAYENLDVAHRLQLVGSLALNLSRGLMRSNSYSTSQTDYIIVSLLCWYPLFNSTVLITVHSFSLPNSMSSNPIVHGDLNPVRN